MAIDCRLIAKSFELKKKGNMYWHLYIVITNAASDDTILTTITISHWVTLVY